jgi:hypothetical protein
MPLCSTSSGESLGNPQHQPPHGVPIQCCAFGLASGDQLPGIIHVRREENVKRRAILNLLSQCAGCAEGKLHHDAGALFVAGRNFLQRGAQVRRSGHVDLAVGSFSSGGRHAEDQHQPGN